MSQLENISRILLAAGGLVHPQQGKGVYLLYVEDGALISTLWTGNDFSEKELVADSARPNSTAAYLFTPTVKSVVYVSPSSTLSVARYSEDEEEWVSDDSVEQFQVDPDGKVTAAVGSDGRPHTFFQSPSKTLIHVDDAWTPTVLPANPVNGTPLLAMVVEGQMHLLYVSANDNCMHRVHQQQDGGWTNNSLPQYLFKVKPRRFVMVSEGIGAPVPLALTEQNQLLLFKANGDSEILGIVNDEGKFVPSRSEENAPGFTALCCRGPRCRMLDFTNLRVTR